MNLMQLPDERNSKRQISEEKEWRQKKNGHKKYNLYYTLLSYQHSFPCLPSSHITLDSSQGRRIQKECVKGKGDVS